MGESTIRVEGTERRSRVLKFLGLCGGWNARQNKNTAKHKRKKEVAIRDSGRFGFPGKRSSLSGVVGLRQMNRGG